MRTIKFEAIAGDMRDVSGDLLEPAGRGFSGAAPDPATHPRLVETTRPARPRRPEGEAARPVPLVVDLDGTLVASDLLIECAFATLGRRPAAIIDIIGGLRRGKADLKHRLARSAAFDPAALPYDPEVLALIRQARAEGRPVYLASASNGLLVERVAAHLGLFTGWFASDADTNLAGAVKARQLVDAFGENGFDYVGNSADDLPVWQVARRSIAIRTPRRVAARLSSACPDARHLPAQPAGLRGWAKLLRVHQYAKNALVFLPLLAAHVITFGAIGQALAAFVAFSLCASSVYIVNDLVDLQDDRAHRSKCRRPLASGAMPLWQAVVAAPVLLIAAIAVAASVSLPFLAVLAGYFVITTSYTFALKRMMLIDVLTLAVLYLARVIGGAVATDVPMSTWLLGFCLMVFLSLALIKRYVELAARRDARLPDSKSRDYRASDLEMVAALAAAAGFNAIVVFAVYISTPAAGALYSTPEVLWLAIPLLLYWIARALMLASRRELHDDPMVFALKDRVSLLTMGAAALLVVGAL